MYKTYLAAGALTIALAASTAFADDGRPMRPAILLQGEHMQTTAALLGSVTSVDDSSIIVSAKNGTTYTVDTSSATIVRIPNDSITTSDIAVGDTVLVQGAISGSAIAATRIMDGIPAAAAALQARSNEQGDHEDGHLRSGTSSVPSEFVGEKKNLISAIGRVITNIVDKRDDRGDRGPVATIVGGSISDVGANTFSITLPARGDRATSTATIMTDASTTFVLTGATSSFSDIQANRFAVVQGIITSTSTMTIAARRVEISESTSTLPKSFFGLGAEFATPSTTARIEFKNIVQTVFQKLGSIFKF